MSQAAVGTPLTHGYESPTNTQFGVFLDNKVGKLLDLVDIFRGHVIELAALSVVESADHAVVRVVTSRAELARRLLNRAELPYSETEVLVVEIGMGKTLSMMCRSLLAAELNIKYIYPLLVQPRGLPAVVVHTDDMLLSAQILRRKLFTLFGENDLGENRPHDTPGTPNDPEPRI